MAKVIPSILTSPGVAKKQMEYYQKEIGAKIVSLIPFNEQIVPNLTKEEYENSVMHGEISFGGSPIYISCSNQKQVHNGDIQIFLGFDLNNSEEVKKAKQIFEKFSLDGEVIVNLEEQFWGDIYGIVKDKFDITWQIMISKNN